VAPLDSNLLRKTHRSFRFFDMSIPGSLKVIGTDTDRSATYDFLLTFHSNHGPVSYRFRDKRRFQSKIANFPNHPVYFVPTLTGFPLELGIGATSQGVKELE